VSRAESGETAQVNPEGYTSHSPDRAWWWDGTRWLPAYSRDRSRWFNGVGWVVLKPRWHRWCMGIGVLVIAVSVVVLIPIAGMIAMGDPIYNPKTGQTDIPNPPLWVVFGPFALILLGGTLLIVPPIHQRILTSRAYTARP